MVSTPEGFTDNSPRYSMTPTPVNKTSARKSLCLFTIILDVKNKTVIRQVGAAKSRLKAIKSGTTLCEIKTKQKMCSSPRRAVCSHYLVCSKNSLLIVGIGPILNKDLKFIFDLIALIVRAFIVRYKD